MKRILYAVLAGLILVLIVLGGTVISFGGVFLVICVFIIPALLVWWIGSKFKKR